MSLAEMWHINQMVKDLIKSSEVKQIINDGFKLEQIDSLKKSVVMQALEDCDWNKSRAAEQLGINRTTLQEIVKRWQIDKTSDAVRSILPAYIQHQRSEITNDIVKTEVIKFTKSMINQRLNDFNGSIKKITGNI